MRTTYRPDGQVSRIETGNVAGVTDPDWTAMTVAERVDIAFDANSRPVRSSLVVGGAVRSRADTSYDLLGRPLCTAQRMDPLDWGASAANACSQDPSPSAAFGPDRITRTVRDAVGRVTEQWTAVGTPLEAAEARASYTPNGRVATLTDGENNVTAFGYDGHDRLARTDFPAAAPHGATFELLTLDPAGNVTSRRLRDGQIVGFTYDALGRLTLKDRPGVEADVTYQYDLLGRMTGASQPGHALTFAWDALGRRVSETGPLGTVASRFDPAGRRTRVTHPDGNFFVYDHFATGEAARIRQGDPATDLPAAGVAPLAVFAYDDRGRRTTLTRGNGAVTNYAYADPAGRLSSLQQDLAGTANDLTLGFEYNPAGQIVSNSRSNGAYALLAVPGAQETSVNDLNQIAEVNGTTVAHDARGNLTSDGSTGYAYDSDNRLVSAAGARSAILSYDPLGRLYRVQGGEGDFRILYEGDEAVVEVGVFGNVGRRFVHGPGVDEPLVWYAGSGLLDPRSLHADERGSILATQHGDGSVNVNRYDEYGVPASSNVGRFQYTGQRWLPMLQLHYFDARMYNGGLGGRFMQPDPIGYGDGLNLYAYVRGDPVNRRDPSGTCTQATGSRICLEHMSAGSAQMVAAEFGIMWTGSTEGGGNASSQGWDKIRPIVEKATGQRARWIAPGADAFPTEKEAAMKWRATYGELIPHLPDRTELWSAIVAVGKNSYGFTFPHLLTLVRDRFGNETANFQLEPGKGQMAAHIHSHDESGPRGFSAADITGLMGRRFTGYVVHELEDCPFAMTPRQAGTADEGEGLNICTGTRR